jgi:hypothetical protein
MCGTDHEFTWSVVDEIEGHDGSSGEVIQCVACGRCYVPEADGTFTPVTNAVLVDAGAWDGHNDGQGLFASPYWERLNG